MSDAEDTVETGTEETFVFDDWVKAAGLSRKATNTLRQEDLTTERTLKLLERADVRSLNLQLGQAKLLEAAIHSLTSEVKDAHAEDHQHQPDPADETQRTEDTTTTIKDLRQQATNIQASGELFDLLSLNQNQNKAQATTMEGLSRPAEVSSFEAASKGSFFDPRINLTVKATTNKAVHITQFLSERSKKRRLSRRKELVMSGSGSEDSEKVTLVRLDDSHPYAGIYLEEWAGANTRLMYHLRKTGRLTTDEIDFYLAYTAKIFDLAEKYVWSSILDFDYCYREAQAEYGFTWGIVSPHMELQLLAPKPRMQPSTHYTGQSAKPNPKTSTGKQVVKTEECHMYLANGFCRFGAKCKYSHPSLARGADSNASGTDQPKKG